MRISACTGVNPYHRSNLNFSAVTKSPSQLKTAAEPENNSKLLKTASCAAGALVLLGTGIYIWKHKKLPKNTTLQQKIETLTPLPDEALAHSLPEKVKNALSVNNNYEKFKNFIASPPKDIKPATGANSSVYEMPFLDKYVLKVLNPDKKTEPNKIPLGIFPPDVNLGQPVWIHPDNYRIILLKKVSGKPNAIENWSGTIWNKELNAPMQVTPEQAMIHFTNLSRISKMEQSVFDDLAQQIKILDTTPKMEGDTLPGFKTDCINPNNLMVDFKNNKMNIIDYFGKDHPAHQNSHMDMVAVIGDFTLFQEYCDLLNPSLQKQMLNALKTVNEKSFKAAQKVGLTTDKHVFLNFIDETNKYFPIPGVKKPNGTGEYVRSYDVRAREFLELIESLK